MLCTRNPTTCVGRDPLAAKMEQGRVGLMSTSLLAASGEPSLERILGTLVAGDMLLLPLYESTLFVFTYLPSRPPWLHVSWQDHGAVHASGAKKGKHGSSQRVPSRVRLLCLAMCQTDGTCS